MNDQVPKVGIGNEELTPPTSGSERGKNSTPAVASIALQIVAGLCWVYAIAQIFFWNIDGTLAGLLPANFAWLLPLKSLLFLLTVCFLFLVFGTRSAILIILYVLAYPLIIVFYKLPRLLYKNGSWVLVVGITNAIVSFFTSLKWIVVFTTTYSLALTTALFFNQPALMFATASLLVVFVVVAFVRSFISALHPSRVLTLYSKALGAVKSFRPRIFSLEDSLKSLDTLAMNEKQIEKWNSNLQTSVLFNRICLFTARRLQEYQKSEWKILPSILGLVGLICFAILSFAGANFALYKASPEQYAIDGYPRFFSFFYYSFNVFIFSSSPSVLATGVISQTLLMIQSAFSLVLGLILVTLIFSNRTQRTIADLDAVISDLQQEATEMEAFIRDEYRVPNISSAIDHLRAAKTELASVIYWFTRKIDLNT